MDRPYKYVADLGVEMQKIQEDFAVIDGNMIAIALDYKFYLNPKFQEQDINELRDNISYRLRATNLHVDILANILNSLDKELTHIFSKESSNTEILHHFSERKLDISSLFDSVIFHAASAFDYVGNLVGFVTSKKKLNWQNIAKSAGDNNHCLIKSDLGKTIKEVNREFVQRLYNHRSLLIHWGTEKRTSSLSIDYAGGKVTGKIVSSSTFNKEFVELRKLNKEYDLSMSYVLVWLLQQTSKSILKIQYGLKNYMEENRGDSKPYMYIKGQNNELLPVSMGYWGEEK